MAAWGSWLTELPVACHPVLTAHCQVLWPLGSLLPLRGSRRPMWACSTGNGFEHRELESGIRVTGAVALETGAGGTGRQRRGCHGAQRTELGTLLLLRHGPFRISPGPWST